MRITFLQAGGTIDKDYPQTKNAWAFEIGEPAVKRILAKLAPTFDFEIISVLKKDSTLITDSDRAKIVKLCKDIKNNKIIISHGTDTMLETAQFLDIIKNKVVILMGAMRPEQFSNSDAPINLGVAIGAVQSLPEGVYVAMHGWVLPYAQMTRDPSTHKFIPKEFIN